MGRAMRGFTLLEMILVLVLLGLAAALVPPALSGLGLTTELRGSARQLAAGLRAARSQAITRQEAAVLTVDVAERLFTVTGSHRQVSLPSKDRADIVINTAEAEIVDDNRASIRFFPDGSSTGGNIQLRDGRVVYRVNVEWLTGRIDIVEEDAE